MGKVLLIYSKITESGIRVLGQIRMVIELDLSEEGTKNLLLQDSSHHVSNPIAFIWNFVCDLAPFQIARYMMLVSSKVLPTRKHQENVLKEDEDD